MFSVRLSEKKPKTIVLAGSLKRVELATLWFKLTRKNKKK
jgi:ABC-type transporter Mla MlaB component